MEKKSTVTSGTLIKVTLLMDEYVPFRERTIRIWLPENYDQNNSAKKYPVLYMHDGQNLFDKYTSFAGEWEIDETISKLIDEGHEGAIVVGIDNSSDRLGELSPTWLRSEYGEILPRQSGEKYARFIVKTVIPYINKNFQTDTRRIKTGIGGSSMGGVMSLFMSLSYPDVFGYSLLFSTALSLYEVSAIEHFIKSKIEIMKIHPKLYLYSGAAGGDKTIAKYVKIMHEIFLKYGYPEKLIATKVDENSDHNEPAWAKHFPAAFLWLTSQNN